MPRRPSSTPKPDIESLQDQITHLADVINVLRESIDELRDAFEHAVRNGRIQYTHDDPEPPPHITSMALDPTAKDLQLNAVPSEHLAKLRADAVEASPPPPASPHNHRPSHQAHLFDT